MHLQSNYSLHCQNRNESSYSFRNYANICSISIPRRSACKQSLQCLVYLSTCECMSILPMLDCYESKNICQAIYAYIANRE